MRPTSKNEETQSTSTNRLAERSTIVNPSPERGKETGGADLTAVEDLGRHLRESGYDEPGIKAALGGLDLWKSRMLSGTVATRREGPVPLLTALFQELRPTPRDVAEAVLAPVSIDGLVAAGLLRVEGDDVVAPLQITHWFGLLVAHDGFDGKTLARDYVAGGNRSAETLARSTVRVPVGSAFDAGCGSGVQTLLAAQHARRVVGVDLNPRAVELTRISAALNGLANVEAREGDWFEPVRGEQFDLVLANPPYVVSPDTTLLFRDGDRKGRDEIHGVVPEVVRGVAELLAPGAVGHVLCDWVVRRGEDRYAAPRAWTDGLGRDVCVVDFGAETPLAYAARWNTPLGHADPAGYATTVERWMAHYARHDVEEIHFGLVVLRRGFSAEPWFHTVEAAGSPHGDGGRQLLRIIQAQDFLRGTGPLEPRLHEERFRAVDGHAVAERSEFRDGAYHPDDARVTLSDGLGTLVTLEPAALQILLALDGQRTLDETLAGLAGEHGADRAQLADFGANTVRALLALGLVERV